MILAYPFRQVGTYLLGRTKVYYFGMPTHPAEWGNPAATIGVSGSYLHRRCWPKPLKLEQSWYISDVQRSLLPFQATNDNSGLLTQVHWERRKDSWEVVYSHE
jgi:hypothetical protein